MSGSLRNVQLALLRGHVPQAWRALAYPSSHTCHLAAWLSDMCQRLQQLAEWSVTPSEPPRTVWLGGLVHPEAFITAIKQAAARERSLRLDQLAVHAEVTRRATSDHVLAASRNGTYVTGLHLEGAWWDAAAQRLDRHPATSTLTSTAAPQLLPIVNCFAVPAEARGHGSSAEAASLSYAYECPVYRTRECAGAGAPLLTVRMQSRQAPVRWLVGGAALLLEA
eukprot:TRINITY_DN1652_c1_g1_i2.p1 TRINITY_DN1652_c1_g1~~TRINITY_DN1652_c1_g1_i2.p1  ORF type:complete len:223 (-),score=78.58 TRINITY_DN1652_c1_g1_i2:209-877(-)